MIVVQSCEWTPVASDGEGRVRYRCSRTGCGITTAFTRRAPAQIVSQCRTVSPPTGPGTQLLLLAELRATDPSLAGNRLESLFAALGIPPCGGCAKRRDWLNRAHAWLRGDSDAAA